MEEKHIKLINEILDLPTPCLASVDLEFKVSLSGKGEFWDLVYTFSDVQGDKIIKKTTEFLDLDDIGGDGLFIILDGLLRELKK